MTCSIVKLPGGGTAIVKHANARTPRCKFCKTDDHFENSRPATLLCDFPVGFTLGGDPITCDAPICTHCALRVGDKDFCPKHPRTK